MARRRTRPVARMKKRERKVHNARAAESETFYSIGDLLMTFVIEEALQKGSPAFV